MRVLLPLSLLLASAPAFAAGVPVMEAKPNAGVEGRVLTRGAAWNCTGDACKAASDASRPKVLCERLVKEVGALDKFTVDGKAWDADKLAKCNAKAK